MKFTKAVIIALAASVLVFGLSGAAFAFHNGGVAYCEGCHTMHNAGDAAASGNDPEGAELWTGSGGTPGTVEIYKTAPFQPSTMHTLGSGNNQYLTRGSDPSSTCMACHAQSDTALADEQLSSQDSGDQHIVTLPDGAGSELNGVITGTQAVPHNSPGGDFFWIAENYSYGGTGSEGGNHGHIITAADFTSFSGITAALTVAPGAPATEAYPQSALACNSCHNPHGRVNGGTRWGNKPVSGSGSYGGLIAEDPDSVGLVARLAQANNTTVWNNSSAATYTASTNTLADNHVAVPSGTIVGNYRLLGDTRYLAGDDGDIGGTYDPYVGSKAGFPDQTYTFNYGAPIAWAPMDNFEYGGSKTSKGDNSTYHEATTGDADPGAEAYNDVQHVDYIYGMSEWCANCHAGFLNDNAAGGGNTKTVHRHPAGNGAKMDGIYSMYNAYQGTGMYSSSTDQPNTPGSYWALVPFERSSVAGNIYGPYDTHGPDSHSQVMCLTCHRAHASPFDYDTRWDTTAEYVSGSTIFQAIDGANGSGDWLQYAVATTAPYYGRAWKAGQEDGSGSTSAAGAYGGNYQRNLCNKCHVQD